MSAQVSAILTKSASYTDIPASQFLQTFGKSKVLFQCTLLGFSVPLTMYLLTLTSTQTLISIVNIH